MWWKKPEITPEVDLHIHWLGERGIVRRQGLTTQAWMKGCRDTSDPSALALATHQGSPCATFRYSYEITGADIVTQIDAMADALDLPIDEVATAPLRVRTGRQWIEIEGETLLDQLLHAGNEYVDGAHVLLTDSSHIVLVHRDVEVEARQLLGI